MYSVHVHEEMMPGLRYDKNPFFSLFSAIARSHEIVQEKNTSVETEDDIFLKLSF